jgi:cytochrome P450
MVAHMALGCANYDPEVYADPFRFDITRNPRDIMTFGFGPHFCPGNVLARSVLRTVIGTLVQTFPNIRLANPDETIVYGGMPTERFPLRVLLQVD